MTENKKKNCKIRRNNSLNRLKANKTKKKCEIHNIAKILKRQFELLKIFEFRMQWTTVLLFLKVIIIKVRLVSIAWRNEILLIYVLALSIYQDLFLVWVTATQTTVSWLVFKEDNVGTSSYLELTCRWNAFVKMY